MRVNKRKPRNEVSAPPSTSTKEYEKTVSEVEKTAAANLKEHNKLMKQIKKLEEENANLKLQQELNVPLNAHEKKIINAIKVESIAQKKDEPILSATKLKGHYKVHRSHYRKAVDSLLEKEMISIKKVTYSGEVTTFAWKIL